MGMNGGNQRAGLSIERSGLEIPARAEILAEVSAPLVPPNKLT